jgi:flavorubredoxin
MKAVKVTDKVYWVGAIDWNIKDFHGYTINKGSSYNAYLILGKTPVLIDTVKAPFYDEMLERVKSVIEPRDIKIIVSNHTEMDHSGGIRRAIADIKPERVLASVFGEKHLKDHFGADLPVEAVANGSSLDLGEDKLTFVESRMLHWPDSMVSFLNGENILFCNDIFGMHYASAKRFDDEVSEQEWIYECKKYYANIVLPYSKTVLAFLSQVKKLGLAPKIICPDHGLIWRKNPQRIVELFAEFAAQKNKRKAVIVYDTMWESTDKMAAQICDGIASVGAEVKQMSLHHYHRSDIVTELLDSRALIVGSPVLNQELFPTVVDVLTYLKGLKKEGLLGAAFGSYGWSEGVLGQIETFLESMGVEIAAPLVTSKFVPTQAKLRECFDFGVAIGKKILKKQ